MIIRKLSVEDIANILKLKDDIFETIFPCSKGEWVQFLIQNINNPKFYMIGVFRRNAMKCYAVALNNIRKPICDSVYGVYWSGGKKYEQEVIDNISVWAKECGAKSFILNSKNKTKMSGYGFVEKSTLMEKAI